MKTLLILIVVGGMAAFGGAFFGLWQIPGLENMPTVESLGKARLESREAEVQRRLSGSDGAPPAGPLRANPNGALGTRSGLLRQSGQRLEE